MHRTTRALVILLAVRAVAACDRPGAAGRALMPVAEAKPVASANSACPAPAGTAWLPVAPHEPPVGLPAAVVDLGSAESLALVSGTWRYADATVTAVAGRDVGADLKPSGRPNRTLDYAPKAQTRDFDDSKWPVIEPGTLEQRRGHGKLSFGWYRLHVTLPSRLGALDTTGMTVAFEIVVDDYAEVWVDGTLGAVLGAPSGHVVSGFNAPNRVVLTRDARPGQSFNLAVFGANGPISASPENFLWIRSATLDFHARETPALAGAGSVERFDPALDRVVAPDAKLEKLAAGFLFTEGPAWNAAEQSLFFSDPNANTIYRYETDGALSVVRVKSGYKGIDIGRYHQPGSNGLAFDDEGRLTVGEHGNRRVTRLEKNGVLTVLADRYQGKRLNSPNDLVYKSDGSLYFTDPPFGLPAAYDDPQKELPFSGIFRLAANGELTLVSQELKGPNGLAFSPDERFLYVDNWETTRKVVLRYPVKADGSLDQPTIFFDMTGAPGEEALDGLKVDTLGNVYVSGPGGVWILSSEGKRLGVLHVAELPANFAWGEADRKALYMTARTGIYRVRLNVAGAVAFGR
jgi:gluconolactonase